MIRKVSGRASDSTRLLQDPLSLTPTTAPNPSTISPVMENSDSSINEANENLSEAGGYQVQYGDLCEKYFAATGSELHSLTVSFDYEMALSVDQPVPQGFTPLSYWAPALEWGILWSVAQELGLHGCTMKDDASVQSPIRPNLLVSLSSLRMDELDSSLDGASCQFLTSLSGQCYPMVGYMTANFVGDSGAYPAIEAYLLDVIQSRMNGDLTLTGAVESTLYLGDRSSLMAPIAPASSPLSIGGLAQESSPSGSTNSSASTVILATSLSTAAGIIILAAVALFIFSSRRRRDDNRKISIISEVGEDIEHVETGSSRHSSESHDEEKSPLSSPYNSGPLTLPELLADTLADGSVMTDGTIGSGEEITVLSGGEVTVFSGGEATVISASSFDSDKAVGENGHAADRVNDVSMLEDKALLPPKPPLGPSKQPPSVQQTLTKRRKKKKKKKKNKQTLIPRVSSRENVKAMETITEDNLEEGEDSADEDYSDSEYSYETDESGSRSRDPSPIRSDNACGELHAPMF